MASSQDAIKLLNAYAKRSGTPLISFERFVDFSRKQIERLAEENPQFEPLLENLPEELARLVRELEKSNALSIDAEGDEIRAITYVQYHADLIRAAYARLQSQPELPFPTEESLDLQLPGSSITVVDIKSEFVPWISRSEQEKPMLLRLMFPDGIGSLIIVSDLIPKTFIQYAVQKVRSYLRTARNASYMHQKMSVLFRGREIALKDMINSVLATPDQAVNTITEPSDFTFQFWTQLSTNIIKEYSQKSDKLVEEHGFCQAAYSVGYYNVYYRGIQQKNLERETALKSIEARLKRKPYAFTITDMYNFTDAKGVPLVKKFPPESLHAYLQERVRPRNEKDLPDLVRVTTAARKDYYIGKEFVLPLVMERIFLASTELKDQYAAEWSGLLKNDDRPNQMFHNSDFEEDVHGKLVRLDPVLASLLKFDLLFLCALDAGISANAGHEVNKLFDWNEKKLKSLPAILGLDRETLYRDAMLLLPFWQAVPFLRGIVRFFKRVFLGTKAPRKGRRAARGSAAKPSYRSAAGENDAVASGAAANGAAGNGATANGAGTSSVERLPNGGAGLGPRGGGPQAGVVGSSGSTGKVLAPSGGITDAATAHRGQPTKKQQDAVFRAAIAKLQTSFVPSGQSIDATMRQLIDKWNPLLEPTAKKNLVEDVNSLVRDYLRRVRSGFRIKPPDAARIRNMAREVSEHEALGKIRKKDPLKEYIELYMLRVLGK